MIDIIMSKIASFRKRRSLCSDMFLSFIITFAAAVFTYDAYMPKNFMEFYSTLTVIVCLLTWAVLSFLSGVFKKYDYMVFMLLFWLIPQIIIYAAESGPEMLRMSIIMYLLSEFSSMLTHAPAEAAGHLLFKVGALPMVFIIILMCVFLFLAGILFSDWKKWKNFIR